MYHMFRKTASNILLMAVLAAAAMLPVKARAAELLMFESRSCIYCLRWERDVGSLYDKTAEAKVLPLRRVDVDRQSASGVTLQSPVRYTPTFVVVDKGREIGRIEGFASDDAFWGRLDELAAKITAAITPETNRI
ncbi:MAG: thioredoxin family protein [Rhizobiales bacterium]|nr:thioredoxin family protein [Hyphomicrobiales bacterium]